MNTSRDFLKDFTLSFKNLVSSKKSFFTSGLNLLSYSTNYNYDEEKKKLDNVNNVLNKIISIIYNPYFHVEEKHVIKRSELSGKLDHQSFQDTLKDPILWKQKGNHMSPEYVHTKQTVDSIDIYENRFICLLINKLEEQIDEFEEDISPLVESFQDHYQTKQFTFGTYSMIRNIQRKNYPYNPFVVLNNDSSNELNLLCKKIKTKIKNIKQTSFYSICSKKPISNLVKPTNILIHENLYSYCYKYYMNYYKNENKDERIKQIYYYNYFFVFLLYYLKKNKVLKRKNTPKIKFDENGMISFNEFIIEHYRFKFTFTQDKQNYGIKVRVNLSLDNKQDYSEYYLMCVDKYTLKNAEYVKKIRNSLEDKNFLLITGNNIVKDYNYVLTFSYKNNKRSRNEKLLDDLISYLSILIKSDNELYSRFCPICGQTKIQYDKDTYKCLNCNSEYIIDMIDQTSMLWIKSYRKE